MLTGEGLSGGHAVGPVFVQLEGAFDNRRYRPEQWEQARQDALQLIEDKSNIGGVAAEVLSAHRMMLEDPDLIGFIREASEQGSLLEIRQLVQERFVAPLEDLDDDYMRSRAEDIREVLDEWCQFVSSGSNIPIRLQNPVIVVGERISTEWLLSQDLTLIQGIILVHGTATMHLAIIARNMGIPILRVTKEVYAQVCQAVWISLDADAGMIRVSSTPIHETQHKGGCSPRVHKRIPVVYKGEVVEVRANVGSVAECERAIHTGADGIGLFRTELAFATAERNVANVADHTDVYSRALDVINGLPLTIRALDIGADKSVAGVPMDIEPNPQLGRRGIRYLQRHPDLLRTQLEGLQSAGAGRPLEIMFPMVADPSEWQFAIAMTREIFEGYQGPLSLGVMLEVPAAGLLLPELRSSGVDFISIGTNDLTQYLVARDREADWNLRSEILPVLRFVHYVMTLAPVHAAVCGELGGNTALTPLLLAMGVREFSVSIPAVGRVKERVSQSQYIDTDKVLSLLWECHDDNELLSRLHVIP